MQPAQGYFDPNVAQHKQRKLIKIIISLLVTAVVVLALWSVVGSKPKPTEQLGIVLARHNEIVRVLDEFKDSPRSNEAQSLMVRARVTLASDSTELLSFNITITPEQEAQAVYAGINDDLEQAVRNNVFDEVIIEYITEMLADNTSVLETVYRQTSKDDVKSVIDQILTNYQELL